MKNKKAEFGTKEKIAFLILGGAMGAAAALLLAPKSGEELREEISDAALKGVEKGREAATQIGARANEYYGSARERAGEYYETTRERAADLFETAEEQAKMLAEKTRAAAVAPRNSFTAAIEAGKKAYFEEKRRSEAEIIRGGRASYPKELGAGITDKI